MMGQLEFCAQGSSRIQTQEHHPHMGLCVCVLVSFGGKHPFLGGFEGKPTGNSLFGFPEKRAHPHLFVLKQPQPQHTS